jgi:hypothetical protein
MTRSAESEDPLAALDRATRVIDALTADGLVQMQADFLEELGIPHRAWQTLIGEKAAGLGEQVAESRRTTPAPDSVVLGAAVIAGMGEGFLLGVQFMREREGAT